MPVPLGPGAQQAAEAELLSIVHSEVEAAAFGALGGRLLALFETQQRCGGSAALWAARLADTADTILSGEILLDALGVDAALRDERSEVDGLKLAGNQLSTLPTELASLQDLVSVELKGCPMRCPPQEICEQGALAIRGFLQDLEVGGATCNCLDVVFLGSPGAGASSTTFWCLRWREQSRSHR